MRNKYFVSSTLVETERPDGTRARITKEKSIRIKTSDEPFYKVFINFVGWIYGIKSITAIHILTKMLEYGEYNKGSIVMNTDRRKEIMSFLGISKPTFISCMHQLIAAGVLCKEKRVDQATGEVKLSKDTYVLNPDIFWFGDPKHRDELQVIFRSSISDEGKIVSSTRTEESEWDVAQKEFTYTPTEGCIPAKPVSDEKLGDTSTITSEVNQPNVSDLLNT